jgi:hypothetical protein
MAVLAVALLCCTSKSPESTRSGFLGLGPPEVFDQTGSFGVGCPDGWTYRRVGLFGVPGILFQPADPLPGGISGGIFALGGVSAAIGIREPSDDPHDLQAQLRTQMAARVGEQRVGAWGDHDAMWFSGLVRDDVMSSEGRTDGFVAAVKDDAGTWHVYYITSAPKGIFADALSEVVAGFQPGRLDPTPSIAPSTAPSGGTCEGVFDSVSPPPVQQTEAIIVTFDVDATIEVTNPVECTDPSPGSDGCTLLPGLEGASAMQDRSSFRLLISPTATNAEVRAILERANSSPHVKSVQVVKRQI